MNPSSYQLELGSISFFPICKSLFLPIGAADPPPLPRRNHLPETSAARFLNPRRSHLPLLASDSGYLSKSELHDAKVFPVKPVKDLLVDQIRLRRTSKCRWTLYKWIVIKGVSMIFEREDGGSEGFDFSTSPYPFPMNLYGGEGNIWEAGLPRKSISCSLVEKPLCLYNP